VCERAGAEDAVRRPIEHRSGSRRIGDHLEGAVEVGGQFANAAAQEQRMAVAVHCHLVTGIDDLAGKRRPLRDLFADEEEGCRRAAAS